MTYGDAARRKRQQLFHPAPGDLLVFYTGLSPRPPGDRPKLFAIGYITVRRVHDLRAGDLGRPDLRRRFARTAHFLRRPRDRHLALVEGNPASTRILARAIPLGDGRDCLLRDLTGIGYAAIMARRAFVLITVLMLISQSAWAQGGDAQKGKQVFSQCQACHSLEAGKNGVGPSLHDIIGKKAGNVPGHNFSGAMKNSNVVWNEQTLTEFLSDPQKFIPGNKMPFTGIKDKTQLHNLVAYLEQAAK